jgi:hypothetical protein
VAESFTKGEEVLTRTSYREQEQIKTNRETGVQNTPNGEGRGCERKKCA